MFDAPARAEPGQRGPATCAARVVARVGLSATTMCASRYTTSTGERHRHLGGQLAVEPHAHARPVRRVRRHGPPVGPDHQPRGEHRLDRPRRGPASRCTRVLLHSGPRPVDGQPHAHRVHPRRWGSGAGGGGVRRLIGVKGTGARSPGRRTENGGPRPRTRQDVDHALPHQPGRAPGALARRPQPTVPAGSGLLLRLVAGRGRAAVHAAFQDPVLRQWHIRSCDPRTRPPAGSRSGSRGWADEREAQWAVVDETTDELLRPGRARQILLGDGVAEVAYWTVARAPAGRRRARHGGRDPLGLRGDRLPPPGTHARHRQRGVLPGRRQGRFRPGGHQAQRPQPPRDGWHDMHLHARVRGD